MLGLLGTLLVAAGGADPASEPTSVTYTDGFITSHDGTRIQAQVWRPGGVTEDTPAPVLLEVTPYSGLAGPGEPSGAARVVQGAHERGWTYVEVALRGYGKSEGCGDLFGPGEQGDVVAAAAWAAAQPWSDGRVVMWGASYPGWSVLAGAANDAPIVAGAAGSAPVSLHDLWYDDGVPHNNTHVASVEGLGAAHVGDRTGILAAYRLLVPYRRGTPPADLAAQPECLAQDIAGFPDASDPKSPYAAARDLASKLEHADVPMLFLHGFQDRNVPAEQLGGWIEYGGPRAGIFGHHDHQAPARPDVVSYDAIFDWFQSRLEGRSIARHRVLVEDSAGHWRTEETYPPTDVASHRLPIRPGRVADAHDVGAYAIDRAHMALTATRPFPDRTRLAGQVHLDVSYEPPALVGLPENGVSSRIVAIVYDVAPDGTAELVTRGAALLNRGGRVFLDTQYTDWVVEPGHRLLLALAGTDHTAYEFYSGVLRASSFDVIGGIWTLPTVVNARPRLVDGGVPTPVAPMERTQLAPGLVAAHEIDGPVPSSCRGCPGATGRPLVEVAAPLDTTVPIGASGTVTPGGPPAERSINIEVSEGLGDVNLQVVLRPADPAELSLTVLDVDKQAVVGAGRGRGRSIESAVTPLIDPGTYRIDIANLGGPETTVSVGARLYRAAPRTPSGPQWAPQRP